MSPTETGHFLFVDSENPELAIRMERGSLGLLIDAGAVLVKHMNDVEGGPQTDKEKQLADTVESLSALYEELFGPVEVIRD